MKLLHFFLLSFLLLSSFFVFISHNPVHSVLFYFLFCFLDVRFYLVAILFLIFDLEAAFFFPWCISFSFLSLEGIWGMVDFILELLFGFIYAWKIGALDWE